MHVATILADKASELLCIEPTASCLEAAASMVKQDVGALLVLDAEAERGVGGLITERALVRRLAKGSTAEAPVSEAMERRLIWVRRDEDTARCMALMTTQRRRYLLVEGDDGTPAGLISIGDVVKAQLADQQFIIDQLGSYMGDMPTPDQGNPTV